MGFTIKPIFVRRISRMKKLFLFSFLCSVAVGLFAQQGGERGYTFLQIPTNARSAAMGGHLISHQCNINQIADNPALLDLGKQNISFNYANYVGDINGGTVFFHPHQKAKNYAFSIQYFNYGSFFEANTSGNITGEFSAGEYALAGYRKFNITEKLSAGLASNFLISTFPQNVNLGLGLTGGMYYTESEKDLSLGFVIKHAGLQIYSQNQTSSALPFEIQLGVSKRLAKAPFRLSILAHNLQTWDLSYPDESTIEVDPFTGEEKQKVFTLDKFMRHFNAGVEFFPAKSFMLRFSYNHQRRREMQLATRSGFAGFGVGTGINFNKFTFDYGITGYHIAGALHMFTLNTKI